jgi:hypothetical protein
LAAQAAIDDLAPAARAPAFDLSTLEADAQNSGPLDLLAGARHSSASRNRPCLSASAVRPCAGQIPPANYPLCGQAHAALHQLRLTAVLAVPWAVLLCITSLYEAGTSGINDPLYAWAQAVYCALFIMPALAGALITGCLEPKEDPASTSWTPLLAAIGGVLVAWPARMLSMFHLQRGGSLEGFSTA